MTPDDWYPDPEQPSVRALDGMAANGPPRPVDQQPRPGDLMTAYGPALAPGYPSATDAQSIYKPGARK